MLIGKEVYLRALEPEDIDLLYKWENDTEIWHLGNTFVPFSRKVLKEYLQQAALDIYTTKQLRLVICLSNGNAIGCIDLFEFDANNLRAGVGILIAERAEQQKGFATDALKILKAYCKEKLNLHQLFCNISADNEISYSLFAKNGFEKSGTKKNWQRKNTGYVDEYFLQCFL